MLFCFECHLHLQKLVGDELHLLCRTGGDILTAERHELKRLDNTDLYGSNASQHGAASAVFASPDLYTHPVNQSDSSLAPPHYFPLTLHFVTCRGRASQLSRKSPTIPCQLSESGWYLQHVIGNRIHLICGIHMRRHPVYTPVYLSAQR